MGLFCFLFLSVSPQKRFFALLMTTGSGFILVRQPHSTPLEIPAPANWLPLLRGLSSSLVGPFSELPETPIPTGNLQVWALAQQNLFSGLLDSDNSKFFLFSSPKDGNCLLQFCYLSVPLPFSLQYLINQFLQLSSFCKKKSLEWFLFSQLNPYCKSHFISLLGLL